MKYEIIVIGLGGIGSAALYHAAKQGKSVLGIDQYQAPHSYGSTHGGTRITRIANGEGDVHTLLALRAETLWKDAQRHVGFELLNQCGGIIVKDNSSGSFNNKEDYFADTMAMAEKYEISHELWDYRTAGQKYPQFRFDKTESVLYEPTAGFLRPEACIQAHLQLAQQQGAEIRQNTQVLNIQEVAGGVHLETSEGIFEAEQIILTAGPWIGQLLSKYQPLFRIIRQITFWFDVEDWEAFTPENFPVFIRPSRQGGKGMYGFPAIDGKDGGFKIASEYLAKPTSLDDIDRTVHSDEIDEIYQLDIQPHLNGVSNHCIHAATCLFTETPDYGFLIDRHPQMKSVIVASPCSGYGFKFAPALGEAITQLALNEISCVDLSNFSFGRLVN